MMDDLFAAPGWSKLLMKTQTNGYYPCLITFYLNGFAYIPLSDPIDW